MEFTLQDTASNSTFEVIPEGEILAAEVSNCEVRDSFYDDERNPGQKKKQVSFRFLVTEPGDYQGMTVFGNTPETFSNHPDCRLRVWVQELLSADEIPVGFKFDTDNLIGLPCRIAVGVRERLAADGQTKIQKNFVADVMRAAPTRLASDVF